MGMYSTYIEGWIEVLNKNALIKLRRELDMMHLVDEEGNVDFAEWSGHKLEGYWYPDTMKILTAIAPFVKGEVVFLYEEGYQFRLSFKQGKVFYARASNHWGDEEELKEELK